MANEAGECELSQQKAGKRKPPRGGETLKGTAKKAVAHGGHTHSHTLIFVSSFCEMTLSEVMATKVHSYLRGESRSSAPN